MVAGPAADLLRPAGQQVSEEDSESKTPMSVLHLNGP